MSLSSSPPHQGSLEYLNITKKRCCNTFNYLCFGPKSSSLKILGNLGPHAFESLFINYLKESYECRSKDDIEAYYSESERGYDEIPYMLVLPKKISSLCLATLDEDYSALIMLDRDNQSLIEAIYTASHQGSELCLKILLLMNF